SSSVSIGDLAENAPATEYPPLHARIQEQSPPERSAALAKTIPRPSRAPTESVQAEAANGLMRSYHATPSVSGFVPAPASRPRFRITATGQLERSIQSSIWIPVAIPADAHLRVISISDDDV